MKELLESIDNSLSLVVPELVLGLGFIVLLLAGMVKISRPVIWMLAIAFFAVAIGTVAYTGIGTQAIIFQGMLGLDGFSNYLKVLFDSAAILACVLSASRARQHSSEYMAMIMAAVLGGHLLVMSNNFLMIFISLEMISLASYVLAGFSFDKAGSEGSLKYFLFGATASAIMLYGLSILYGFTGTLNLNDDRFLTNLMGNDSPLITIASFMVLAGILYKIAAAPMHPWVPDVYQAAPVPVMAFFSIVPKLAGIGILARFILGVNLFGQSVQDWQVIIAIISLISITVGNFSALLQSNAKRLMAYSSIAHAGFLLVGLAAFSPEGLNFLLFYATVYTLMNFLVFHYLDIFEARGIVDLKDFTSAGRSHPIPILFMLIGFLSLVGLPPTAGFTAKLFIFSGLWDSYQATDKPVLLWLLVIGLLNTVVSLFYYLRIPWLAFLRSGGSVTPTPNEADGQNATLGSPLENLFGLLLVLLVLALFFIPGLLMGWINRTNFVE